jgi:hypothetical protein
MSGERAPTTYYEIAKRRQPDQSEPSTEIPRLPANSPWSGDEVPPEPPVGPDATQLVDMSKVQRPAKSRGEGPAKPS